MTELTSFLVAIYDALSEAEMTAITHGQARRVELRRAGSLPQDVAVPVYHASDVEVTLDVGLAAEQTAQGTEIHLTESAPEEGSSITFSVELFELIEEQDVADIDYEDILGAMPTGQTRAATSAEPSSATRSESSDRSTSEDEPDSERDPTETTDPDGDTERGDSTTDSTTDDVAGSDDTVSESIDLGDEIPLMDDPLSGSGAASTSAAGSGSDAPAGESDPAEPESSPTEAEPGDEEVEAVDGVGPTFSDRLRTHGIETVADLTGNSADELAELVSTDDYTVSSKRTATWLERAERRRESADDAERD